ADVFGVDGARDNRAMAGEHELQLGQGPGQSRNHDALPGRMQVQTDLVDQHDPAALERIVVVLEPSAQVIKEVAEQADVAAVAIGERGEADFDAAALEQIFVTVELTREAGVSGDQLVEEFADSCVQLWLLAGEFGEPTGERREG